MQPVGKLGQIEGVPADTWGSVSGLLYEDENDRGMTSGYLKPDEARRIAKGIARLPELMGKAEQT